MAGLNECLGKMEDAVRKPPFRQSGGRANEVNYWIFDYLPDRELEVRERIQCMQNRNAKGGEEFDLKKFDL